MPAWKIGKSHLQLLIISSQTKQAINIINYLFRGSIPSTGFPRNMCGIKFDLPKKNRPTRWAKKKHQLEAYKVGPPTILINSS